MKADTATRPRREILPLVTCAVFAFGSFALGDRGEPLWWAGWFWIACCLAWFLPQRRSLPLDQIEVTDSGVTRRFGAALFGKKKVESVRWDDLTRVEIVTTDEGPYIEDFFFVLVGSDGNGVAVSNQHAVDHGLVAQLQQRLTGLDNKAIIDASLSVERRRFLVWQKPG